MDPALTWLYVPGDRPDRFDKALGSGTDVVILDLEDAVASDRKPTARAAVAELLAGPRANDDPPIQVRVNPPGSPWFEADVETIVRLPRLSGIRLPKADSVAAILALAERLPPSGAVTLHLLVETARGLEAAFELASAHPLVASIGLGEADLRSELGLRDDAGLAWARGRIVVAAAAAGLPPPPMSVYTDLADDGGLAASCQLGRGLGFLGRAAIHPRQLPVIEAAFLPEEAEVAEARATLEALAAAEGSGSGVAVLPGGRFVDRAMARRAQIVVDLAARRVRRLPG